MNIALFGGSFDPIHNGHLRAARAAARRFRLDCVLFAPTANPPHKRNRHLTPFFHRYAMAALACASEPRFRPSTIESSEARPHFSVDTLARIKAELGKGDHLFFLAGLDAFLDIPQWKEPGRLLGMADFIVVSRPGFCWDQVLEAIPPSLAPRRRGHAIALDHTTVHMLTGVNAPISSSAIRDVIGKGGRVTGLLPRLVEEYIMKEEIYKTVREIE